MKLTVAREAILAALSRCAAIVDAKAAHFSARAVLLETAAGRILTVRATDCIAANVRVTVTDIDHDGPASVAVSAKDLLDRVKAMPDAAITLATNEAGMLEVTAKGTRRFKVRTFPATEMPTWPTMKGVSVELPGAAVVSALATVAHAMNDDASKMNQHCTLLTLGPKLGAEASNGGAGAVWDADIPTAPASLLLSFRTAGVLRRLLDGVDTVTVEHSPTHAAFRNGGVEFVTSLVAATFPLLRHIMFEALKPTAKAEVPRKAMLDAVQAVSIVSDAVRLAFEDGVLSVSGLGAESGEDAADVVPADWTGEAAPTLFFCKNIVDALQASATDNVVIEMGPDALQPLRMTSGGSTFVAMPRRDK